MESRVGLTARRSSVAARATASTATASAAAAAAISTTTTIAVALVATATACAAFGHQIDTGTHRVRLAAWCAGHAGLAGEAGHPVLSQARTRCVHVV